MKIFKLSILLTILFFSNILAAKEIYLSSMKAKDNRQKLVEAHKKAKTGDIIIVDLDITFGILDKPITISKNGLIIKGKEKASGKYKIERPNVKDFILKVTGGNITVKNLLFIKGMQQLYFNYAGKGATSITIENCYFKQGKYTGINFKGKFENTTIKNSTFENTKFSLQSMDCPILKNFIVDSCKFIGGDHQLSLDNPHAKIIEHKNIQIKNSHFGLCDRFNIALANTRNVIISNNTFLGGTGNYSQALHFEDRTKDVLVKNNTISCMADVAILLYATDKIGHGTGRRLTEAEKIESGSGNITLDNNTITSGSADTAISVGYGKGFLKIKSNNTIISKNVGIKSFKSKQTIVFEIDNNVIIKGKKYGDIKNISNSTTKKQYIDIK